MGVSPHAKPLKTAGKWEASIVPQLAHHGGYIGFPREEWALRADAGTDGPSQVGCCGLLGAGVTLCERLWLDLGSDLPIFTHLAHGTYRSIMDQSSQQRPLSEPVT